jgi:hypothetical protein
VDSALVAVDTRDAPALAALMRTTSIACGTDDGLGGPPDCRSAPGMPAEGTVVDAFPWNTCEREWQFDLQAFAERLLERVGELYAIVRIENYTPENELPDGGYGLIYTNVDPRLETAHALILSDDGIVAADATCGGLAESFLLDQPPFNAPEVILEGPAFD